MANSYFKFKQFTIQQDKCAMKVTTDACLFGALLADNIFALANTINTIHSLDIGTGTGLLSLMAAQKNNQINIDAIELDKSASEQATDNIDDSPWAERITVINENILSFVPGKQYDFIFSNPPFFENDLKSADKAKNNAKHATSLGLLQLLQIVESLLTTAGAFSVLLPFNRIDYFIAESKKCGLHLSKQVMVKQTDKHNFFRGILFFNRTENNPVLSEIIIKDTAHNYTPEFSAALKDYYLFL
jgi:tRNA1Val (adenine37-N6)-methyltransferase